MSVTIGPVTASVQSTQTEAWSRYTPLLDQFIHNLLLERFIGEASDSAAPVE